jgi:hypothetical protein
MTESPAKRVRMEPLTAALDQDQRADVLEYFAQRGSRAKQLETEVATLSEANKRISQELEQAQQTSRSLKVASFPGLQIANEEHGQPEGLTKRHWSGAQALPTLPLQKRFCSGTV